MTIIIKDTPKDAKSILAKIARDLISFNKKQRIDKEVTKQYFKK